MKLPTKCTVTSDQTYLPRCDLDNMIVAFEQFQVAEEHAWYSSINDG